MSFWQSKSGIEITGSAKDAFAPSFEIIPEGTTACASIYHIELIEKEPTEYADAQKFYQITWKLTTGDFKNREVTQKLKVFQGTPEGIDRNLNMMKLIMDLCQFKPPHSNAPSADDLRPMTGKILGIKIREWSLQKRDGSGVMEGNFVSEVSDAALMYTGLGVKKEHKKAPPSHADTAFSRNPKGQEAVVDDDIPF